jgi:hypothetical protein
VCWPHHSRVSFLPSRESQPPPSDTLPLSLGWAFWTFSYSLPGSTRGPQVPAPHNGQLSHASLGAQGLSLQAPAPQVSITPVVGSTLQGPSVSAQKPSKATCTLQIRLGTLPSTVHCTYPRTTSCWTSLAHVHRKRSEQGKPTEEGRQQAPLPGEHGVDWGWGDSKRT